MTKKIFLGLALLAALVSCNKEFTPATTTEDQGKTLVIGASLDPLTKMDYTAQEDGSYKATFLTNGNDALYAYFVKEAAGTKTALGKPVKLSIDLTTLSADKRSANFVAKSALIPEGATHIYTYFANGGTNTAYVDSVLVDLSAQNGFANANSNHLISAVSPISELKEGENEYNLQSISLKYQTALVKFVLTLPEGDTLNVGAATPIDIEGAGIHDTLSVFGKSGDFTKLGKITLIPEEKEKATVITAYGVVFASDDFAGSTVKLWNGTESYVAEFAPTATIEAGKSYTAARTLKKGAFFVDKWVPDEAGSLDWKASGVTSDVSWLTFADNKLSWAENATGAVRTGKAKDEKGNEYTITQIGANEFKGSWKLTCKIFSSNGFVGAADPGTLKGITFGEPLLGETLEDVDGKVYKNQIGVRGLYYTAVMDATVDIDYDAKTLRVGMFLDARNNAQAVSNNVAGYGYACFLPGMGTKTTSLWAKPWNFVQPDLSNTPEKDYTWLWFSVSEDLSTLHYNPNTEETIQSLNTSAATSACQICAITVAVSKSENVNASDVRSSWDVVYQGNAYSGTPGGLLFERDNS